jgi:hypothetical protein
MIVADPFNVQFDFARRPTPVPAALRPEWRIASLLLALNQCWGNKATRRQLHVLNWAIRTAESRAIFLRVLSGELKPDEAIVRFDPVVERALDFAAGESLVSISGDHVLLTDKGVDFVKRLSREKDCMKLEKQFLSAVGRKLTQVQVESFLTWEAK